MSSLSRATKAELIARLTAQIEATEAAQAAARAERERALAVLAVALTGAALWLLF